MKIPNGNIGKAIGYAESEIIDGALKVSLIIYDKQTRIKVIKFLLSQGINVE